MRCFFESFIIFFGKITDKIKLILLSFVTNYFTLRKYKEKNTLGSLMTWV
jgi:hypothetical protein